MVAFKIEQFKSQLVFCSGQPSYRHTLCSNFLEFPSHCLRAQSNLHFCSVSGLFVTMGKQVFVIKKSLTICYYTKCNPNKTVCKKIMAINILPSQFYVALSWVSFFYFCEATVPLSSPLQALKIFQLRCLYNLPTKMSLDMKLEQFLALGNEVATAFL